MPVPSPGLGEKNRQIPFRLRPHALARRHTRNGFCLGHRHRAAVSTGGVTAPSSCPARPRSKFSKSNRWPAARSLQALETKTKRPGTLRCLGLCEESLEGNAPMRCSLHPVANDPHHGDAHTNQPRDATAGAGLHAGQPRQHARARGPVRVGGW